MTALLTARRNQGFTAALWLWVILQSAAFRATEAFTVVAPHHRRSVTHPPTHQQMSVGGGNGSSNESQQQQDNDSDDDDDDCANEEECEIDWDKMPMTTDKAMLRLEMKWRLDEAADGCDVDHTPQSCGSDPCPDCQQRGGNLCRFCRGTGMLYMAASTSGARTMGEQAEFVSCPVCTGGIEQCRSCQGTGWVASWTRLQQFL